jgi:hypothetical protein
MSATNVQLPPKAKLPLKRFSTFRHESGPRTIEAAESRDSYHPRQESRQNSGNGKGLNFYIRNYWPGSHLLEFPISLLKHSKTSTKQTENNNPLESLNEHTGIRRAPLQPFFEVPTDDELSVDLPFDLGPDFEKIEPMDSVKAWLADHNESSPVITTTYNASDDQNSAEYKPLDKAEKKPLRANYYIAKAEIALNRGGKRDSFNASKAWLDEHNVKLDETGKKFIGKDWKGYNLNNVIFDRATLKDINASDAKMVKASLVHTTALNCKFDHAAMIGVNAQDFYAGSSSFYKAVISGDWSRAQLPYTIRARKDITISPSTDFTDTIFPDSSWDILHEQMKDPRTPNMVEARAHLKKLDNLSKTSIASSFTANTAFSTSSPSLSDMIQDELDLRKKQQSAPTLMDMLQVDKNLCARQKLSPSQRAHIRFEIPENWRAYPKPLRIRMLVDMSNYDSSWQKHLMDTIRST